MSAFIVTRIRNEAFTGTPTHLLLLKRFILKPREKSVDDALHVRRALGRHRVAGVHRVRSRDGDGLLGRRAERPRTHIASVARKLVADLDRVRAWEWLEEKALSDENKVSA
jgi:hypothetical protein